MSEDTRVGTPAPAWLYDDTTGQTRWWNGASWTDHSKPLDPVVRTWAEPRPLAPASRATSPERPSRVGSAKASRVVLLISLLGIATLLVLGFVALGLAAASGTVDSAALEGEIAAWANGQTGEVSQVTCPDSTPDAAGAVFLCSVTGANGAEWDVAVTVHADAVTWEPAP